jgi:hypothetical protein
MMKGMNRSLLVLRSVNMEGIFAGHAAFERRSTAARSCRRRWC